MARIEKQYRQSVADADTEKWPVYVVFKNNAIIIMAHDMPVELTFKEEEIKAHGIVDCLKWLCYDAVTADLDTKSSEILRLLLNV